MKRTVAVLLAITACGCGSMPAKYIPSQMGPCGRQEIVSGLSVSIAAKSDHVPIGEPIYFNVTISNASDMIFWVPLEPQIMFAWTYANGRRDNFIGEYPTERYFTSQDAVKMYPGEVRQSQTKIPTGYFPARGITEFKAIYSAPRNTNPDLMPFWNGEVRSNCYGVNISKR